MCLTQVKSALKAARPEGMPMSDIEEKMKSTTPTESEKASVPSEWAEAHPEWVEIIQWERCEKHGAEFPRLVKLASGHIVSGVDQCQQCKAEKEERKRFGRMAIPRRFQSCSVAGYKVTCDGQKAAREAVIEFCKTVKERIPHGDSIVMSGNPGTGKTHLACAIAKVASAAGFSVLFTRVRPMVRSIRETWKPSSKETEADAIRRFASVDLLILDEVGVQEGSDNEHLLLFDVLAERYESMKSTILLSNFPWTVSAKDKEKGRVDLQDVLGDKICDRFFEDGSLVIPFTWESWRGRK